MRKLKGSSKSNTESGMYSKGDSKVREKISNRGILIFYIVLMFVLTFSVEREIKGEASPKLKRPYVAADGAVLMDSKTGEILYSKNPDIAFPPASTTKIMTALITLENCNMEDIVTVGKNPPRTEGNNIALVEGEEITVKDMLYALINESANDCANALAEHISGSVESFSIKMNKRAKELGCRKTNFVNPSGLYHKNHRTTARDLALIMQALLKDARFKEIATTTDYIIVPTNKTEKERTINNHNRLVQENSGFYYKSCTGGKTGYTIQSKHSYVVSAEREGVQLITALIHDGQKNFYKDSIALFEYGFNLKKQQSVSMKLRLNPFIIIKNNPVLK